MSCQFLDEKLYRVALSREDAFDEFRDAGMHIVKTADERREHDWA